MRKEASKLVRQSSLFVFFGFLIAGHTFGQSGSSSGTAAYSLGLQFQQNQLVLAQGMSQLFSQGATTAQLSYWLNENQGLMQAQQGLVIQMVAISAAQPLPIITSVTIPEDASQDLDNFLTTQASLANLRVQIHNQLVQQGIVSGEQETALFQQQAGGAVEQQIQRAQNLTAESDQNPVPAPPLLMIPANASLSMRAFLTLRDRLMRGEIQVRNQNLQATQTVRQSALLAWRIANADKFKQLQQLAQNLSTSTL